MQDDINGYKGLISAVITRAILDSLVQPGRDQKTLSPLAKSGLEFLLGKDVGIYLDFLNIFTSLLQLFGIFGNDD